MCSAARSVQQEGYTQGRACKTKDVSAVGGLVAMERYACQFTKHALRSKAKRTHENASARPGKGVEHARLVLMIIQKVYLLMNTHVCTLR